VTPLELVALGVAFAGTVAALHALAGRLGPPPERTRALTAVVFGNGLYLLTEVGSGGAFGLAVEPALSSRVTLPLLVVAVACQLGGGGLLVRWYLGRSADDGPGRSDRPSQQ